MRNIEISDFAFGYLTKKAELEGMPGRLADALDVAICGSVMRGKRAQRKCASDNSALLRLKNEMGYSYREIARALGGVSPSSVLRWARNPESLPLDKEKMCLEILDNTAPA